MTRRSSALAGALAVTALSLVLVPAAMAAKADTFEVTITNLTSGQPLTPPVVATHRGKKRIFDVGSRATFELKEIAENGNLAPQVNALQSDKQVFDVFEGSAPIVPSSRVGPTPFSAHATFTIRADKGAHRLSWASMLICTNDGFTGVNSLSLPKKAGDSVTALTAGYDAGTELNTEDFADIVPPCQGLIGVSSGEPGTGVSNPALAEGGLIHHHPGIRGGADLLPAIHGWTDPVARIDVTAIG
jgi:Spondin_N